MSDAPFAVAADVSSRGLLLTPENQAIADQLCDDASDMIRSRWPDVDDRIASGALRETSVIRVVANMVKRAMERTAPEGTQSQSQAAGPFSVSATYLASASERLYFTSEDRRLFDANGRERRAFGVNMFQPANPWCPPYSSSYWD